MPNSVTIRDGHDNFFTPLRFILAYMVLLGHAFVVVLGTSSDEPKIFFNLTASYIAVNLFFIASGFLVTGSMLFRKNMASYASARLLRIFPALIVHVILMMVLFGAATTNLPLKDYFTDPQTLWQPVKVLSFADTDMVLPGALSHNHEQIGSGTLWTLRYELLAYIGTFIAFALGLMNKKWMLLAQFTGFAILSIIVTRMGWHEHFPGTINSIIRFGVCYGLGAAIYAYRHRIKLHWAGIPVLIGLTSLTYGSAVFEVLSALMLGYILFFLAYIRLPKLDFLKKYSDISYGLYIYHWPVLQGIRYFWPDVGILQIIALGSPIAIGLAWLSWHIVEHPSLKLKDAFAQKLSRKRLQIVESPSV